MFLAVTIASGVTTYTNLFIIIINEGLLLRGMEGKRMGTANEGKEIPQGQGEQNKHWFRDIALNVDSSLRPLPDARNQPFTKPEVQNAAHRPQTRTGPGPHRQRA